MNSSNLSKREEVELFLPHREPMVFLDEVLLVDDEKASVALVISEHSPFYSHELKGMPAWVGIEYMAQAIAVWSGSQQVKAGVPVTIGFLLGTRRYDSEHSVFDEGAKLIIDAQVRYVEESGLSAFHCTIEQVLDPVNGDVKEKRLLASASINAFRPESPEQFVRSARA